MVESQPKGLSADFLSGLSYQQKETFTMIAMLLTLPDDRLRETLAVWYAEILEQLVKDGHEVTIEESYLII